MQSKMVFGVGYNNRKYSSKIREYTLWHSMIRRSYSSVYQKKKPTYVGCTVSDNFKNYHIFYEWCQDQVGFKYNDWHLDKDILVKGNKIYSEDTCVFVPPDINSLFTLSGNARGNYPPGVSLKQETGRYMSGCTIGSKKKLYLGYYDTPELAFYAYKEIKEMAVKDAANRFLGKLDDRVYEALMNYEVEITD